MGKKLPTHLVIKQDLAGGVTHCLLDITKWELMEEGTPCPPHFQAETRDRRSLSAHSTTR
jgi:hypothetical protein